MSPSRRPVYGSWWFSIICTRWKCRHHTTEFVLSWFSWRLIDRGFWCVHIHWWLLSSFPFEWWCVFPDGCIFCVLCIEAHIFIIDSRDVRFVTNFLSRVQFCVIALERHISMWAVLCIWYRQISGCAKFMRTFQSRYRQRKDTFWDSFRGECLHIRVCLDDWIVWYI